MANLKTLGSSVFSRLLTFLLISSFLFFLFDTYQESYGSYKVLQSSLQDKQEEVVLIQNQIDEWNNHCLLYTSPSPRDVSSSRMPSSA